MVIHYQIGDSSKSTAHPHSGWSGLLGWYYLVRANLFEGRKRSIVNKTGQQHCSDGMDPVAAYISSPAASPRVATPGVFAIPTSVSELNRHSTIVVRNWLATSFPVYPNSGVR